MKKNILPLTGLSARDFKLNRLVKNEIIESHSKIKETRFQTNQTDGWAKRNS